MPQSVQNVTFNISGGLSTGKLCVWRSDATAQFVRQADIAPKHGSFTIALEPDSIYSISTTTGQQKGSFADIPADKNFPFPYYETFDEYAAPGQWGYLPHYTADIAGIFEIAERPDKTGKCLRQVIGAKAAKLGSRMDALHDHRRRTLAGLRSQRRYVSGQRRLGGRHGPRQQRRQRLRLRSQRILFAAGGGWQLRFGHCQARPASGTGGQEHQAHGRRQFRRAGENKWPPAPPPTSPGINGTT